MTVVFCQGSFTVFYTLSEAWSGVNWADLMAAQGAFGTDFYDRSARTVIKIGPKGTLGSHEIRLIHSAPSLGQSIQLCPSVSRKPQTLNAPRRRLIID